MRQTPWVIVIPAARILELISMYSRCSKRRFQSVLFPITTPESALSLMPPCFMGLAQKTQNKILSSRLCNFDCWFCVTIYAPLNSYTAL
jgi:hypothetical protein